MTTMLTLLTAVGAGFGKTGADFGEKSFRFGNKMGHGGNELSVLFPLLHLVTWVLIIILLVALIRWIWAKGDKK